MLPKLHLAEDAFALHLFLQNPEGLVDIVVPDENLHLISFSIVGALAKVPPPNMLVFTTIGAGATAQICDSAIFFKAGGP
jgi:hypothetical protein